MALLKRIIPCLDVRDGRVVKGEQFIALKDMGDPVELAKRYEDQGADEIVLLDISASLEARQTAREMVARVASTLSIPFTVGGGIRCLADIHDMLEAGADKVSLNSAALAQPDLIDQAAAHFGAQCIVVAIDFRDSTNDGVVYSHGGTRVTEKHIVPWANEVAARGAGELLLTCIDRDGTGAGFEQILTGALGRELSIPVIASGGAKTAQHFVDVFASGADAALAAGIFHRNEVNVNDIKATMQRHHIPVRWQPTYPNTPTTHSIKYTGTTT